MIEYVGIPYNLLNNGGLNCWTFVALIYAKELDQELIDFTPESNSVSAINAAFTKAFMDGSHGFCQVDRPADFDVVVIKAFRKMSTMFHCGVMYDNNVVHCSREHKQSVYEPLSKMSKGGDVEFWRLLSSTQR